MKWEPLVIEVRVSGVSMQAKDIHKVVQMKHVTTQIANALREVKAGEPVTVTKIATNTVYLSGSVTHQEVWTITGSHDTPGVTKAR